MIDCDWSSPEEASLCIAGAIFYWSDALPVTQPTTSKGGSEHRRKQLRSLMSPRNHWNRLCEFFGWFITGWTLPLLASHPRIIWREYILFMAAPCSPYVLPVVLDSPNCNKLCTWRYNMPPPLSSPVGAQAPCAQPSRRNRNVAVLYHAANTLTAAAALRVKAALIKAAWWPWPLTLWPWKWCPSHVWHGLSLCQFWSS